MHRNCLTQRQKVTLLSTPGTILIIAPLVALFVSAMIGNKVWFDWLQQSFIGNGFYIVPVTIVSAPLLAWALKISIIDDIRNDRRRARADQLLLQFAPMYYERIQVPPWLRVAGAITIVVGVCFIVLAILLILKAI